MAKLSVAVAALLLLTSGADAFSCRKINMRRNQSLRMALPTPEESAKALTDYMSKSHEAKLQAVKAAEEKAATEIRGLKSQIEELEIERASSIVQSSPPAALVEGSREDLANKLVAYQKFMADYIVKAQDQKVKAVRAAEEAAEKRFKDQLLLLGGSATAPAAAPAENKVFADRSAKVSAAAKAGKSRWGDSENQKASQKVGVVGTVPPNQAAPASSFETPAPEPVVTVPVVEVPVPEEVAAADHGLRADGGVGGLTLAERIHFGANASGAPAAAVAAPAASKGPTLFDMRNAKVSAAAAAGKSRWGEREVRKAMDLARALPAAPSTPVIEVSPEVQAADHGLRADGGVGGPTLAERVNLGARLLQTA
uniref:Uncharacterized protein n=1 Tax=Trieres chinensis TaxID=1514140 RepID=A0A7S1Z322_TRICV|mmetsp:Transcript_16647/g.34121  ORF Transcript_16647/g.34121 Transcript_16647/m.34121 type:complete len:368 (+) Transcript_16647:115-1218(+)